MTMLNVIANAYKVPLILTAGKSEAIAVKLLKGSQVEATMKNLISARSVIEQIAARGEQLDPVIGAYEPAARTRIIEEVSTGEIQRQLAGDLLDRLAKYLAKNPRDVGNPPS